MIAACGSSGHTVTTAGTATAHGPTPPPLPAHHHDLFRVTVPRSPGVSYSQRVVRLSTGASVELRLCSGTIHRQRGHLTGAFFFAPANDGRSPKNNCPDELAQGDAVVVRGFRFTVTKLYAMPDENNDAADVRVTPPG